MRTLALLILLVAGCAEAAMFGFRQPQIGGTNLVLWFPFNETTGTNFTDKVSNQSPASRFASPPRTNGIAGGALTCFTNNGMSPESLIISTLRLYTNTTISIWIKGVTIPFGGQPEPILCSESAQGFRFRGNGYNFCWHLINYKENNNTGLSPSNVWTHVVVSYGNWYTNGVKHTGEGMTWGSAEYIDVTRLTGSSDAVNHTLYAWLDDVRLYNRELTAEEIKQLYNGGYSTQK